jgi:lipopolysaccharide transport system ATP-binding protein
MQSISTLTRKSFYLKNGNISFEGTTSEAIRHYLDEGARKTDSYRVEPSGNVPQIIAVQVVTSHPGQVHYHGDPMTISFELFTPVPIANAAFSFCIADDHDTRIVHAWLFDDEQPLLRKPGIHRLTCTLPALQLYKGYYSITGFLAQGEGGAHFQTLDRACQFEVVMHGKSRSWQWQDGACKYLEKWTWDVNCE